MKIAILALQGAFIEHEKILNQLNVETIQLRKKDDLKEQFDGLILPGGESTVQGKLLLELDMFDDLRIKIAEGLPVMATCAGLILLAQELSNDTRCYLQTLPVKVKRNAYGRQLGSFYVEDDIRPIGKFPMKFIRAPYIESVSEDVEVLAKVEGHIVAVRYKQQIGMAFHPELTGDTRVHEWFIQRVGQSKIYY